jgi:hypothetical protein
LNPFGSTVCSLISGWEARRLTVDDRDFSQAFIKMEILSFLVLKITFVASIINTAWSIARLAFEISQEIKIWSEVKVRSFDGGGDVKEKTYISKLSDLRV